jgi:hypothetical protein
MQYHWILDVLSDLRTFATDNGLSCLAEQLDDTSLVAAAEIAQVSGLSAGELILHADPSGALCRNAPTSENA